VNGFFCIDKPEGLSSFEVVRRLRRACHAEHAGHNGTLDPLASGVLVCGVGNATRLFEYLPAEPKTYLFSILFGSITDTLDRAGVVTESGGRIPTSEEIGAVLPRFTGAISQEPPRYSALKVKGRRAYRLAREHKEFTLANRTVTIHHLVMESFDPQKNEAGFTVRCSGGTYIRSLARDIARALGTWGYAASIRRIGVGPFTINTACSLAAVETDCAGHLIASATAFSSFHTYVPTPHQTAELACGRDIQITSPSQDPGPLCIISLDKELIAIAEPMGAGRYHPMKVFIKPC
jgi:tRNA pseudouridine55 synthase